MVLKSVWSYRLLFTVLSCLVIFFSLLPFGQYDRSWPGPDLVVCLAAAWILRRPDYVPFWILVLVLLLGDFLLMRPLGLWPLVIVGLTEYLRRRVDHAEVLTFWAEVALVAGCLFAAFMADFLILKLLLAETPPLLGQVLHALATIVFYPAVALFSQVIGVRRLAPGELDSLGARA